MEYENSGALRDSPRPYGAVRDFLFPVRATAGWVLRDGILGFGALRDIPKIPQRCCGTKILWSECDIITLVDSREND